MTTPTDTPDERPAAVPLVTLRPTSPPLGDPFGCGARGCSRDAVLTAVIDDGDGTAPWYMTACPAHESAMREVAATDPASEVNP